MNPLSMKSVPDVSAFTPHKAAKRGYDIVPDPHRGRKEHMLNSGPERFPSHRRHTTFS